VIDPATSEAITAQLFVAVLGASNYTLCRGHLDAGPVGLDRLLDGSARIEIVLQRVLVAARSP
jgi:hypothetical protein